MIVHVTMDEYLEFLDEQPTGQWVLPTKEAETQLNQAITVAAKPVNNSLSSFAASAKQAGYRKPHWTERLQAELDGAKVDVKETSLVLDVGPGWAGRVATK
jgi:hypothetical protein